MKDIIYEKGNYSGALQCYNNSIVLDSNNAEYWNAKGYAFKEMGEWRQAILPFYEAIKLAKEFPDPQKGKAYCLDQLGRKEESQFCYTNAEDLKKLRVIDQLGDNNIINLIIWAILNLRKTQAYYKLYRYSSEDSIIVQEIP